MIILFSMEIITARNLTKDYDGFRAVDQCRFFNHLGRVFWFSWSERGRKDYDHAHAVLLYAADRRRLSESSAMMSQRSQV